MTTVVKVSMHTAVKVNMTTAVKVSKITAVKVSLTTEYISQYKKHVVNYFRNGEPAFDWSGRLERVRRDDLAGGRSRQDHSQGKEDIFKRFKPNFTHLLLFVESESETNYTWFGFFLYSEQTNYGYRGRNVVSS